MDDDGLNMPNWGYYEASPKGHLGLQLMPTMTDRSTKPFLSGREHSAMVSINGGFHPRDCVVSDAPLVPMDYVRESWMNQRDKFLNVLPGHHNFSVIPESSGAHHLHMLHPPDAPMDDKAPRMDNSKKEGGSSKRRTGGGGPKPPKPPKPKRPKKNPRMPKDKSGTSGQHVKPTKESVGLIINGINMDISGIPIPVCSCTGAPQQCYRWGCGGWQSACCTTSLSMYPLPMSIKRRGARIAGRKMSLGAFKKVLEKLAAEGYNFSQAIDLRTHWAKHGTNKFVTIR